MPYDDNDRQLTNTGTGTSTGTSTWTSTGTGTGVIPLLDVREAAQHRRSIRRFESAPIPMADLEAILDVTHLAPSAFNAQPWRFVIVASPETKAQLAAAAFGQPQVTSAPAVIELYTDMQDTLATLEEVVHPNLDEERRASTVADIRARFARQTESEREAWAAGQGHIALGYLLLAAESFGYQTSPMAGFDPAKVRTLLDLPAHVQIPAIVAIGHGTEEGFASHRHSLARIVRAA